MVEFDKFVGVPWEPYPGAKGGFELKSKVRLPTEHAEFTETVTGKSDFVRRRFRIKKDDLEKFGYTTGCPGCRAVNRNNGDKPFGRMQEQNRSRTGESRRCKARARDRAAVRVPRRRREEKGRSK